MQLQISEISFIFTSEIAKINVLNYLHQNYLHQPVRQSISLTASQTNIHMDILNMEMEKKNPAIIRNVYKR